MSNFNRRHFLGALAAASARRSRADTLPPVRAITKGPKFHWFGYYDKLQFDPSSRYVLGMEVGFEHRSPTADDRIRIGMVDLKDNDRWIDLGETRAWCWQQGCMLQWLPGSSEEVIYNDRGDGHYISHILNVKTGKRRTLPGPVYALSPDAKWAVSTDFSRLADMRPGYGYAGIPDKYKDVLAPEQTGIWRMDLTTGKQQLIVSYAQAARVPYKIGDWTGSKHVMAWATHPSHGHKFYIYKDRSEDVEVIAPDVMTVNGHNTYLRGYRWVLNDTYPDKDRLQHPYLYDTETAKRYPLGHFVSPSEYTGEWRCDNHPRSSPDGRKVVIDSPHGGGRQMYLIDISGIGS